MFTTYNSAYVTLMNCIFQDNTKPNNSNHNKQNPIQLLLPHETSLKGE